MRLLVGLGLLVASALVDPNMPQAQTRGPILLGPPTPLSPGNDTLVTPPAPPPVLQPIPERAPPRTTADGSIQIEGLKRLTVDAAGSLTPDSGGLRTDLWAGTPGPIALRLVALLPAAPDSRALRDLQRRLLLSSGPAPADLPTEGALLAARAERLLAMGALDELAALALVAPGRDDEPEIARVLAERALAVADQATACRYHEAMSTRADDRYWLKVGVVCELWRGDTAKAEFGARVLSEVGEHDALLQELVQGAVAGRTGGPQRLAGATAVHLAAAIAAKVRIDPDVMSIDSLPVLVALARGIGDPPFAARLAAAEKAERAGALATDALIALYAEVAVRAGPVDGALRAAEADPSAYSRALLWRTADINPDSAQRARAVRKAFEIAENASSWRQTARVFAPLIRRLDVAAGPDDLPPDAVRALVAAGLAPEARPWMDWLQTGGDAGNTSAGAMYRQVWVAAWIGGGDRLAPYREASVAAWWDELREIDPEGASNLGAAALALMDALGAPVGVDAWRGLAGGPPTSPYETPSAAFRNGVSAAAAAGRMAEAIMLACAGFGEVRLEELDPTAIAGVVMALRGLGLEDDARHLAGEAAVAYGL